jgi:hypothetical protein
MAVLHSDKNIRNQGEIDFPEMFQQRGGLDSKADSRMKFDVSEAVQVLPTFDALNLKEDLLRGIYGYGTDDDF